MAFPTVVRRGLGVSSTSNSTTYAVAPTFSLDTAISAGEDVLWVLIVSADGSPTLSETVGGWTKQGQASESGGAVTQAVWTQETTSAFVAGDLPNYSISSTASEQYSHAMLAFKMGAGKTAGLLFSSGAQGSSTNSNPPSVTNSSGAAQDVIAIATRSGDGTTVATGSPTNYNNLQSRAGGGTNGASTNTAERQINIANSGSEDPGTFTSANEQWVSYTIGVYETSVGYTMPASVGSYGVTGTATSLLAAFMVVAPPGEYLLTGQAATLSKGRSLTVDPGSYTLTGQAATFPRTYILAAGNGETLGAEMVSNGTFATDFSGWGDLGTPVTLSVVSGRLRVLLNSTGAANGAYQTIGGFSVGARYRLGAEMYPGNTVNVARIASNTALDAVFDFDGYGNSFVYDFFAANATIQIAAQVGTVAAYGTSGDYAEFDNIGIKPLNATYALAGQAVTFAKGRTITADAGAYSLTGSVAGLLWGHSMAATVGDYALSGQAAGLLFGRAMPAAVGNYALTGTGVSLTLGVSSYIMPAANFRGEANPDPGLDNAGGWSIGAGWAIAGGKASATAATSAIDRIDAGNTNNATYNWSLTVSNYSAGTIIVTIGNAVVDGISGNGAHSGSLTPTADPGFLQVYGEGLTADVDSFTVIGLDYAISGSAVAFPRIYVMPANTGSYAVTGQIAGLLWGRVLAAAGGSYALTGQTAGFAKGLSFSADAGSYALGGATLSFAYAHNLAADIGAYLLAGQDAILAQGYLLGAAAGAYVYSGQTGGFALGKGFAAAPGVYAITGQSTALSRTRQLTPTPGLYNYYGYPVTLRLVRTPFFPQNAPAMASLIAPNTPAPAVVATAALPGLPPSIVGAAAIPPPQAFVKAAAPPAVELE